MVDDMRKEYDFSRGERGKFFVKDVKFNLPVYLDDEVFAYMEGIAKKEKLMCLQLSISCFGTDWYTPMDGGYPG